jgi:hypothetical protein
MYKNTKSTNRISVEKKRASPRAYLEKVYQSSWTIFVERKIVHQNDFGSIPTASIALLIAENKRYLAKKGYPHTVVDNLPDWFLFHPRISLIIRCLKDVAKTKPNLIPFELHSIVSLEPPHTKNKKLMFPTKIASHSKSRQALAPLGNTQKSDTALALAFNKASKKIKDKKLT